VKIEVLLFAAARQAAHSDSLVVEMATGADVAGLRSALLTACPELLDLMPSSMVAINHEYALDSTVIPPDAEVALIPPVSGG
jgi:molybdopterin converting factor subunit 1